MSRSLLQIDQDNRQCKCELFGAKLFCLSDLGVETRLIAKICPVSAVESTPDFAPELFLKK